MLAALASGCSSGGALDDEARRRLETEWELYQVADPSWDSARTRWYARGGEARVLLIDLLTRDMLRQSMERGWKRPQRELLLLGPEETVPRLLGFMRTMREPAALEALGDTLGAFGAVDPLIQALEQPQPEDSRYFPHFAYKALVRAGGRDAVAYVGQRMNEDPGWERRAAAADALAGARMSDRDQAATLLAGALDREQDAAVRRAQLGALATIADPSTAVTVEAALQRARREGDAVTADKALQAMRAIHGDPGWNG